MLAFWTTSWVVLGGRGDAAEVAALEPGAVPGEGDALGVVHEPVDHSGGDHIVTEHLAPAAELLVAGDDQRGAFVAEVEALGQGVAFARVEACERFGITGSRASIGDQEFSG